MNRTKLVLTALAVTKKRPSRKRQMSILELFEPIRGLTLDLSRDQSVPRKFRNLF